VDATAITEATFEKIVLMLDATPGTAGFGSTQKCPVGAF